MSSNWKTILLGMELLGDNNLSWARNSILNKRDVWKHDSNYLNKLVQAQNKINLLDEDLDENTELKINNNWKSNLNSDLPTLTKTINSVYELASKINNKFNIKKVNNVYLTKDPYQLILETDKGYYDLFLNGNKPVWDLDLESTKKLFNLTNFNLDKNIEKQLIESFWNWCYERSSIRQRLIYDSLEPSWDYNWLNSQRVGGFTGLWFSDLGDNQITKLTDLMSSRYSNSDEDSTTVWKKIQQSLLNGWSNALASKMVNPSLAEAIDTIITHKKRPQWYYVGKDEWLELKPNINQKNNNFKTTKNTSTNILQMNFDNNITGVNLLLDWTSTPVISKLKWKSQIYLK